MTVKDKIVDLKSFFVQCARVWSLLRKPSMNEFKSIAKISGLGILALGLLGFLISIILSLFK
ncbi:MAG: protein translocase SEC61 complex subunit gamma [Nanoarchaeota archaeon]